MFPSFSVCCEEKEQGEGCGDSSFDKVLAVPGRGPEFNARTNIKS